MVATAALVAVGTFVSSIVAVAAVVATVVAVTALVAVTTVVAVAGGDVGETEGAVTGAAGAPPQAASRVRAIDAIAKVSRCFRLTLSSPFPISALLEFITSGP